MIFESIENFSHQVKINLVTRYLQALQDRFNFDACEIIIYHQFECGVQGQLNCSSNKSLDGYFCVPPDKAQAFLLHSMLYRSMIMIHGPHFSHDVWLAGQFPQFTRAHRCMTPQPCGVRGGLFFHSGIAAGKPPVPSSALYVDRKTSNMDQ